MKNESFEAILIQRICKKNKFVFTKTNNFINIECPLCWEYLSLRFSTKSKIYKCLNCHTSGNFINLVMSLKGISLAQAILFLKNSDRIEKKATSPNKKT